MAISRGRTGSLLLCLALLACGSSDAPSGAADGGAGASGPGGLVCTRQGAGAATLTGTWTGTWTVSGATGALTLDLTETGTSVSGTATYGGTPCLKTASVSGTHQGTRLDGRISGTGIDMTFGAQVDSVVSIGGGFEGTAGACGAVKGTFTTTDRRLATRAPARGRRRRAPPRTTPVLLRRRRGARRPTCVARPATGGAGEDCDVTGCTPRPATRRDAEALSAGRASSTSARARTSA